MFVQIRTKGTLGSVFPPQEITINNWIFIKIPIGRGVVDHCGSQMTICNMI